MSTNTFLDAIAWALQVCHGQPEVTFWATRT